MPSFMTEHNDVSTESAFLCYPEETNDRSTSDNFSRLSTSENQTEDQTLISPPLQPYPSVRGRVLETVPLRQPSSTLKHKRKEEMIQKHLAHRKRSSSEPPPLDRPETETDLPCSDASSRPLSAPSPFFNRLAKVKHMQKELREQQRPPLTGSESHGAIVEVAETLSLKDRRHATSDMGADSKSLKHQPSSSAEPSKDENRDIRINIVRRRGGTLSKLQGGSKEARYMGNKEKSTTKGEETPVPAKSIPVAKLREHRRRKLGIVSPVIENAGTLIQNETGIDMQKEFRINDNLPTSSHSSESLGSLITASTGIIESEMAGIIQTRLPKKKVVKTFSQSSESLGSLETASWPLTATEVGVITCPAISRRNPAKNTIDFPLDSSVTDFECDSQSVDRMTNVPSQISESLGSLETIPTPLTETERGAITYTTTTESEGYEASLDQVTESGTTDSYSTSQSGRNGPETHGFSEWASFDRTESGVGESGTSITSSVDLNSRHYSESMEFVRHSSKHSRREPIATTFPDDQAGEASEGAYHTANSSSENESTDFQVEENASTELIAEKPLAFSAEGPGKSFDFRKIEVTEAISIDPSWDANKVYFNEFDNGKKSAGDAVDLFKHKDVDWFSPSPMIFSSPIGSYTAGSTTNNGMMAHIQEQVEEEKKERDLVSLDGVLEQEGIGSDLVDFRWPIMIENSADRDPLTARPVSDFQNLIERDSEADDANLLNDSRSTHYDGDVLLKKEDRIREYNTLGIDDESSIDESCSEDSDQGDYIPDYVPQTNLTEETISLASEHEDFVTSYIPQTNVTEEVISAASEQSDVFDFGANHSPIDSRDSSQFDPIIDTAQITFGVSVDIDGSSRSLVPWDEKEPPAKALSISLASVALPPPPPPFLPASTSSISKKSRSTSKSSTPTPLVAPPPAEKLRKWEEEKARPVEHLKKLHFSKTLLSLPPPPPPPLPKSFFHRGRRKRDLTYKQAIEPNNESTLSAVVFSDARMAEKVDNAISAASLKFDEHISSQGLPASTITNGQQPSSCSGLSFGARTNQSLIYVTDDNNRYEGIDETYRSQESDPSESRRRWVSPDPGRSPFGEAISKVPVLLSRILEFLGDPVAVCRVKMLNRGCRDYVEEKEHRLMRDAVRLGGMSMQVRPAFWLWVTLEKMNYQRNDLREEGHVEELERQGREGKWHSVIDRDVARAFGNLPPHKSGARLRTDSIVRALVSWGRGRMIKRGVKGDGEAPPRLSTSNSYDSDITPTDTVSDWGAVAPASSTASELDESSRLKKNDSEVLINHDDGRGELALSGSVLRDDLKVELRGKLRFVLHALAASNPDVGYCQGMDYVVAHLLRILQETIRWKAAVGTLPDIIESASLSIDDDRLTQDGIAGQYSKIDKSLVVEETLFHVMESFFGTYNLRHFYYPELRCLKTCCRVFERLIQLKLPVLADHFEHHELSVGLFALGWFQTLFLYLPSMPSATVCHMWDIWLVERSFKIFFRVGTAILFLSQPILLNHELEGMMSYLNTFPDATLLSPDILIACALQIKVTNKLLMELEKEVTSTM